MFPFRFITLFICFLLVTVHAAPQSVVRRTDDEGLPRFSAGKKLTLSNGAIGKNFLDNGKTRENVYHLEGAYHPVQPDMARPSKSLLLTFWKEEAGDAPAQAYEQRASLHKAHDLVDYGMVMKPPRQLGLGPIAVVIYKYEASTLTGNGNEAARKSEDQKAKALAGMKEPAAKEYGSMHV
ncbi:hypothetical protein BT96DRAFT_316619 [Gymnopus androsaceus JB14]|uniref:Uncharacterized protein n=1 Tax=Gymnopus androsaceus JB14 TaxID=1447944 RepID=A0A6A4I1V5_9AGAR|nr:hypothetical protein BT96DRAFT_316619 [Gymnopus androsaceus JB14]